MLRSSFQSKPSQTSNLLFPFAHSPLNTRKVNDAQAEREAGTLYMYYYYCTSFSLSPWRKTKGLDGRVEMRKNAVTLSRHGNDSLRGVRSFDLGGDICQEDVRARIRGSPAGCPARSSWPRRTAASAGPSLLAWHPRGPAENNVPINEWENPNEGA